MYLVTGSFQEQLSSYLGQLGGADYQKWVMDAIEKEKLKQQHLKVVINHLESEVSNLAQETVNQMENSMVQVRRGLLTTLPSVNGHLFMTKNACSFSAFFSSRVFPLKIGLKRCQSQLPGTTQLTFRMLPTFPFVVDIALSLKIIVC